MLLLTSIDCCHVLCCVCIQLALQYLSPSPFRRLFRARAYRYREHRIYATAAAAPTDILHAHLGTYQVIRNLRERERCKRERRDQIWNLTDLRSLTLTLTPVIRPNPNISLLTFSNTNPTFDKPHHPRTKSPRSIHPVRHPTQSVTQI